MPEEQVPWLNIQANRTGQKPQSARVLSQRAWQLEFKSPNPQKSLVATTCAYNHSTMGNRTGGLLGLVAAKPVLGQEETLSEESEAGSDRLGFWLARLNIHVYTHGHEWNPQLLKVKYICFLYMLWGKYLFHINRSYTLTSLPDVTKDTPPTRQPWQLGWGPSEEGPQKQHSFRGHFCGAPPASAHTATQEMWTILTSLRRQHQCPFPPSPPFCEEHETALGWWPLGTSSHAPLVHTNFTRVETSEASLQILVLNSPPEKTHFLKTD